MHVKHIKRRCVVIYFLEVLANNCDAHKALVCHTVNTKIMCMLGIVLFAFVIFRQTIVQMHMI